MPILFGRECKVGWGWDSSSGKIVPVEGDPPNYQSHISNDACFCVSFDIKCDNPHIVDFGEVIDIRCRKYLDFCVFFDEQEYQLINWYVCRRYETCGQFSQYLQNCDHYVHQINYGVNLRIILLKQGPPDDPDEIRILLNKKNLNDDQKQIHCKVLINFDEIREMTLGELLHYTEDLKEGKDSPPDIPMYVDCQSLDNSSYKPITIVDVTNFKEFLYLLYYVFRKIEMKLDKAGRSDIVIASESSENLPSLEEAKHAYKAAGRSNFLEMYPVIKSLFLCYVEYTKDSLNRNADITEGDDLPGTVDELKKWLRDLNNWTPKI